jgi:DNA-binding MarR family transcriptional regulator
LEPDRLHHLVMDLFRTAGLILMDPATPGRPASLSQVFALHELDHEAGLSQRELAERLGLEKSTVSRLAAELEAAGLVRRERDPGNRRFYRLEITEAGRRLHHGIASSIHARYLEWTEGMTQEEREGLSVGLPALLRAMREERKPPER